MYSSRIVKGVLADLARRKFTVKSAYRKLAHLPYQDLGFAKIDNHRFLRRGFPEVIYCRGKTNAQIACILKKCRMADGPLLLTLAGDALYDYLKKLVPGLEYNREAKMIYKKPSKSTRKKGKVVIITGGTADFPVAEQARITLELMGNKVAALYDVGVAGIHRLFDRVSLLNGAKAIIVIAGMEGALASVVSGLVSRPVIAVPTSVGYGASFKGIAPLLTMLASCSPGIGVVNIDNGFGAGYLAGLINK